MLLCSPNNSPHKMHLITGCPRKIAKDAVQPCDRAATLVNWCRICTASIASAPPAIRALRRCRRSGRGARAHSLTSCESRTCSVELSSRTLQCRPDVGDAGQGKGPRARHRAQKDAGVSSDLASLSARVKDWWESPSER